MGMKITGYSLSGIPLCFCWRLGINSFWLQLGSSLELSRWHLGINSLWRQLGSPLGFAIPRDSFSGIPLSFPPLGFHLLIHLWGTTFSPVGGLLLFSFLGKHWWKKGGVYLYLEVVRVTERAMEDFMEAGEETEAEDQRGDVE